MTVTAGPIMPKMKGKFCQSDKNIRGEFDQSSCFDLAVLVYIIFRFCNFGTTDFDSVFLAELRS